MHMCAQNCKMVAIYFALVICSSLTAETDNIIIKELSRSVDISTQLVVVKNNITLWNEGTLSINKFEFVTEPDLIGTLAYIEAHSDIPLKVVEGALNWQVILNDVLQPGQQVKLFINCVYIHVLVPYPIHIRQDDTQLVLFNGNIFFYSVYLVEKQTTLVRLSSQKIESYSRFEPITQFGSFLVYGPYKNVAPRSFQELKIHYENNTPFLVVENLKRNIEVSHWGNIAVEEFVELEHRGAVLKGPFSRYEYQFNQQSGFASIRKFVTVLPASAKDIYYKDLIGNVSSSEVTYFDDSVHVHLTLRFPLFGGWKINYIFGYNLPSSEFLYVSGNNFLLHMRIMDYIYKNMVVEKMHTRIVLPEFSSNIRISTEPTVGNFTTGKYFTYLDIPGRPTMHFTGYNLVENHVSSFDLHYSFPYGCMMFEPIYLSVAIFLGFLVYIFISHLHFEIEKKQPMVKRKRHCRRRNKM